jgi:PTH1 family peptidyl-tRNA hydrolase
MIVNMHYIVALGNPGEEYKNTRHNVGRIALEEFFKKNDFSEWTIDKKLKALSSEGKIGKEKILLIEPETFMNNSGLSLKPLAGKIVKKKVYPVGKRSLSYGAEDLIVIHDDLDLPLGKFKISFNKSSGGHRGVESIIKAIKTEAFIRVRVGISPSTPSGKLKKPKGEKDVGDFILGEFKKSEIETLKKISKKVAEALEMIITEGREKAMGEFNRS